MKRKYFLVVEKIQGRWGWGVWSRDGFEACGMAPTKALAFEVGRIARDAYEKLPTRNK